MAADKGLVAIFLRLTQGGFRLEEGALTMERDAEPDAFCAAAALTSERKRSISSSEFFSGHTDSPSFPRMLMISTCPIPFAFSSVAFSMALLMQQTGAMMFPLNRMR